MICNFIEELHAKERKMRKISGYWENWKCPINPGKGEAKDPSFYKIDIANFNCVLYSFLTLDKTPNPDQPAQRHWDGTAIYESMSADNILTVMTKTDPPWKNPDEWQRVKIDALIRATHDNGGKFIWAIGGWSDLTKTIHECQIPTFVEQCVALLKLAGDGIDFDWEHLSEDPKCAVDQRNILAKTLLKLHTALKREGMHDKSIGYTTRFNAFWNDKSRPEGYKQFDSDGEGLTIDQTLRDMGSSLDTIVDWVNIMLYDVPPGDLCSPDGFTLSVYQNILKTFNRCLSKDKIVMGFEPGGQAAAGKWEGMDMDKKAIEYVNHNG